MSKRGRQRRDALEVLESEGKTLEAVLLAWAIIEMQCVVALLRVYGLSSQGPKAKWLTDLHMSDKLRLLKKLELLSVKESTVIQQFKEKRDGPAHRFSSALTIAPAKVGVGLQR